MIYTSDNGSFNFETYYNITSVTGLDLPQLQSETHHVIGRDGEVTFTSGFKNKIVTLTMKLTNDSDLVLRRNIDREMKKVLSLPGTMVFSFDNLLKYNARVLPGTNIDYIAIADTLTIQFEVSPIAVSNYDPDGVWEETEVSWGIIPNPWDDTNNYTLASEGSITVTNYGNIKSTPIFKLGGTGNVTLTLGTETFTISVLEDYIYVDTKNLIVYDSALTNKIALMTAGDFFGLEMGANTIVATGTFIDLTLTFINKDMFI